MSTELISDAQWQIYRDVLRAAHNTFNQKVIQWYRFTHEAFNFGEDDDKHTMVELECLIQYNIYRTWPIDKATPSGGLDSESIMVYLNYDYLLEKNLIQNGQLAYNEKRDYFVINGDVYIDSGHTPAGQAHNKSVAFFLILTKKPADNKTILPPLPTPEP